MHRFRPIVSIFFVRYQIFAALLPLFVVASCLSFFLSWIFDVVAGAEVISVLVAMTMIYGQTIVTEFVFQYFVFDWTHWKKRVKKDNDDTKRKTDICCQWSDGTRRRRKRKKEHIVCSGSCFYFIFSFVSNHRKHVILAGLNINIWDRTECVEHSHRWRKQWR